MKILHLFFVSSFFFALTLCAETKEPDFRDWTSAKGSSVRAKFQKTEEGYILLKKENGAIVKIKPDSLSYEDQIYFKWNHTYRSWDNTLLEDIPELLVLASKKLNSNDVAGYDGIIRFIDNLIVNSKSTLEVIREKGYGFDLTSKQVGAKMHANSFSAQGQKILKEQSENCSFAADWLLSSSYKTSTLAQHKANLIQGFTLQEEQRRLNVLRARKEANEEIALQEKEDAREDRQVAMQKQLNQQALERKAASLERDIDSGTGDPSYSSRARSLANEAQNLGNHNAGSKFSEASRKLDAADTDSYLKRSGMGNSFNSPSRTRDDAVRDLSSGRSNLKSSY
jgi:hypothetical protein